MAPHWENRETGITRGQHFRGLDEAGQREELATWRPVVSRDGDGELAIKMDAFLWNRSGNRKLLSRADSDREAAEPQP